VGRSDIGKCEQQARKYINQNGIQSGEMESFYHRKRGIAFIRENGANTKLVRRWYGDGTAKVGFFQGEIGGVRIDILILSEPGFMGFSRFSRLGILGGVNESKLIFN